MPLRRLSSALCAGLLLSGPAAAIGVTESACLASARSPGPEVCACAQSVADSILTIPDQREAAKIIADPERFAKLQGRSNRAAKAFIERYLGWAALAAERCG